MFRPYGTSGFRLWNSGFELEFGLFFSLYLRIIQFVLIHNIFGFTEGIFKVGERASVGERVGSQSALQSLSMRCSVGESETSVRRLVGVKSGPVSARDAAFLEICTTP